MLYHFLKTALGVVYRKEKKVFGLKTFSNSFFFINEAIINTELQKRQKSCVSLFFVCSV